MRPSQAGQLLREVLKSGIPVHLEGPPGCSKSSLAMAAAADFGEYWEIRAGYHDPSDVRFPIADVQAKTVTWVQSLFPTDPDWQGLINLDELPQASPLMQATFNQVLLTGRVGDYVLPRGAVIMSTGNRVTDRAGANRLNTTLVSRMLTVEIEANAEDWQAWAVGAGIHPVVRGFINFKPGMLFDFDPARPGAFACPRTWEFVSRVYPLVAPERRHPAVSGCVGEGAAAEFLAFSDIYLALPNIEKVLASPSTADIPSEPSIVHALVSALADKAASPDPKVHEALATYACRLPKEYGMLLMRDAVGVDQATAKKGGRKVILIHTKAGQKFLLENRNLMLSK